MIIVEEKSEIIKGGSFGTESALRIKASPKAFKILSDGLYSDKILAVIREISCNAFDAHVDAGKGDVPFTIHLPNAISPNFVIRDNGKGISPENMENIFTVFFESTKTQSNDVVGCLGLGCKSPLSYTDSFIVDSFYGGYKHTYSIYKNESGIPSCLHLSSEVSGEPTGVCITIPVKQSDFYSFSEKAKTVYTQFAVKPIIKGNPIDIPNKNYIISNHIFGLRNRDWRSSQAIMGNISYPLNDLHTSDIQDNIKDVLGLDIDIFFNIGELDVSASREKLSYDKTTVANIKNKVAMVIDTLENTINDAIKDCATLWDARVMYKNIVTNQNLSRLDGNMKIKYKNFQDFDIYGIDLNKLKGEGVIKNNLTGDESDFNFTSYRFYINKNKLRMEGASTVGLDSDVEFIIDDINSKNIKNRIKNYIKDDRSIYVFKFNKDSYTQKVLDLIGINAFVKLSELPIVKAERSYCRSSGSYTTPQYNPKYNRKEFIYTPQHSNGFTHSSYWSPVVINEQEEIVYVIIDRFKINNTKANEYLEPYFVALQDIGLTTSDIKVYGVKIGEAVSEKWVKFETYVKNKLQEHVKDNIEYANYCVYNQYDIDCSIKNAYLNDYIVELGELIKDRSDIQIMKNYFETNKKRHYRNIVKIIGAEENVIRKQSDFLSNTYNNFIKKYPLLSTVKVPYYSKPKKEFLENIINYINLVDNNHKQ